MLSFNEYAEQLAEEFNQKFHSIAEKPTNPNFFETFLLEKLYKLEPLPIIEVIPCGTVVLMHIGKIRGQIVCINVKFDAVQYEVAYMDGTTPKTRWLHHQEFEVVLDDTPKIKLGFNKNK